MLIAPFSLTPAQRSRTAIRRASAAARPVRPPPGALIAWLVFGIGVVLCVPAARGDRVLGATLPFWLIAAPLIDLAWIARRRIARRVSESLAGLLRERRSVRNVRAQRAPRVAACNVARS
jgi:hypothetical protein